jgi:preprotein translocase subunit Sec63
MIFKKALNKYANMSLDAAYNVFGLPMNSEPDEIRKRYRVLALQNHPDLNPGKEEEMSKINAAHDIIQEYLRSGKKPFYTQNQPAKNSYEQMQQQRRIKMKIEKYLYDRLFENGVIEGVWKSGELEDMLKKQQTIKLFDFFTRKEFPTIESFKKYLEELYTIITKEYNFTLLLFMGKTKPEDRAEMTIRYMLYLKKEKKKFDELESYFNVILLPQ